MPRLCLRDYSFDSAMLGGLKHGTVRKKVSPSLYFYQLLVQGEKVKNWKQRYVLMQESAFYYYEKEGVRCNQNGSYPDGLAYSSSIFHLITSLG